MKTTDQSTERKRARKNIITSTKHREILGQEERTGEKSITRNAGALTNLMKTNITMVVVFKIKNTGLYVVRRELCGISNKGHKCGVNGPELSQSANDPQYIYRTSSQDLCVIVFQTSALQSRDGSRILARQRRTTCNSPSNAKGVFIRKS
ncbi:hypothetical protein BS47DRAFT_126035 [Hydnum rufescens UP504]|uniref:Uncharacterized protein n=1 Tax=Hydnum rufescens UP504 TaxID=1448309 RepID=A0A9P6BA71_9AGAM|nr:hypothetical protein BS47DRAFT_126035 [Hydnum rufescens UP504]